MRACARVCVFWSFVFWLLFFCFHHCVLVLSRQGLSDNTILIYLSDNGGPLGYGSYNWPLRGGKASFWEGGMRSHTVFVWPKKMASNVVGTTYSGLFHVTDWYPTLVKAAGGRYRLRSELLE